MAQLKDLLVTGAARVLNKIHGDLSGNVLNYGVCDTAVGTAAKTVTTNGTFELIPGSEVAIKFTHGNSVANPTLNVNNTGAKIIRLNNANISAPLAMEFSDIKAGTTYLFRYDGTYWEMISGGSGSGSAKFLNLYEPRGTTTTLNKAANYVGAGTLFHLIASSNTSTAENGKPPMGDANILHMNWDNSGGYDAQLAISTAAGRMEFRDQPSTKKAWREVVTSTPNTATGSHIKPVFVGTNGVVIASTATIGSSTQPIYLNAGTISTTTYSLSASVNTGVANRIAWYNNANSISSGDITTDGGYLGAISYLTVNEAHQTAYRLKVNGTSFFNGDMTFGSSGTRNIKYQGTKQTHSMIRFLDNTVDTYGNGISVGGGGIVILGAGESASSFETSTAISAGTENTYILADGSIYLQANANTLANRLGFVINTSGHIVPSKAEANNNNAQNLGASGNRWKAVFIGNADSYGSTAKGVYWSNGIPTAMTYSLNANVQTGTANRTAWYSGANTIESGSIVTDGTYLSSVTYLSINAAHQTTYRLYVNGGNTGFGGDILPDATDSRLIGSSTKTWNGAYINGNGNIHWNNLVKLSDTTVITTDTNRGLPRILASQGTNIQQKGNRLYGMPKEAITIEYTTDNGNTWTAWSHTNANTENSSKRAFINGSWPTDGSIAKVGNIANAASGATCSPTVGMGTRLILDFTIENRYGWIECLILGIYTRGHKASLVIDRWNAKTDAWTVVHSEELNNYNQQRIFYPKTTFYMNGNTLNSTNAAYCNKLRITLIITELGTLQRYAPSLGGIAGFGTGNISHSRSATYPYGKRSDNVIAQWGLPIEISDRNNNNILASGQYWQFYGSGAVFTSTAHNYADIYIGNGDRRSTATSTANHHAEGRIIIYGEENTYTLIKNTYVSTAINGLGTGHRNLYIPQLFRDASIMPYYYDSNIQDINLMYDMGFYSQTGNKLSNAPKGYKYGQWITMPYRKASGNIKPDYASQIYIHDGAQSNEMFYRTSSADTWRDWQGVVHITANTAVGSTTQPVYINADGSVSTTTYAISAAINSGVANRIAYYSGANTIASGDITTDGAYLGGVSYLSVNEAHQTTYRLKVNGNIYAASDIITNTNFKANTTGHGLFLKDGASKEYAGIYDNGSNIWIGATSSTGQHHKGNVYISAGHNGTTGYKSIYISIPANGNATTTHTSYPIGYKVTAGSTTKPVYIDNDGAIRPVSYELSANVKAGTANRISWYSGANTIEASSIVTDGTYLSSVTYLTINAAHQTNYKFYVNGNSYLGGASTATGQIYISTATQSTSTATGALVVNGGVGIAKDIYIGGNIFVNASGNQISNITYYTGQSNAGKTYIGWIKFASFDLATNNNLGNQQFDIFISRTSYNSPSSEVYMIRINIGWGGCNVIQLGGSIGTQIIKQFRVVKDNTNHKVYFEYYVDTAYTTYQNTVNFKIIKYHGSALTLLNEVQTETETDFASNWTINLTNGSASPSIGTKDRMTYYAENNMLADTPNVQYRSYLASTSTTRTATGNIRGILITGDCYGNDATYLTSTTAGDFSIGDPGPQIQFGTSEGTPKAALIYTDQDSNGLTGSHLAFVTDKVPGYIVAHGFVAKDRVTIGQRSADTDHNLYVNGTSYFVGASTATGQFYILKSGTSAATKSSNLVIGSSDAGAGGAVGLEFWRGTSASWQIVNDSGTLYFKNNYNSSATTTYAYNVAQFIYGDPAGTGTGSGTARIIFNPVQDATSTTAAGFLVKGGVAIQKQLRVQGAVTLSTGLSVDGPINISNTTESTSTTTGALIVAGGVGIAKRVNIGGQVHISTATDSTSTTTGALVVTGGVGIGKNLYVGGATQLNSTLTVTGATTLNGVLTVNNTSNMQNIIPLATTTYTLGSTASYWKAAYIQGYGNIHWNNLTAINGAVNDSTDPITTTDMGRGLSRIFGSNRQSRPSNVLFGVRNSSMSVEFTTDGGTTWSPCGFNSNIVGFTNEDTVSITPGLNAAGTEFDTYDAHIAGSSSGGGSSAVYAAGYWTNKGVRVTINLAPENRCGNVDMMHLRFGTAAATNNKSYIIIEREDYNGNWTTIKQTTSTRWNSNDYNMIIYPSTRFYMQGSGTSTSTTYCNKLRVTLIVDSWGTAYRYAPRLLALAAYGWHGSLGVANTNTGSEFARAMTTFNTPYIITNRNTGVLEWDSDFLPRQRTTEGAAIVTTNIHNIGNNSRRWAGMYANHVSAGTSDDASYTLSAGTGLFTGALRVQYVLPNVFIKDSSNTVESHSILRFGNANTDNGAFLFLNGPSRTGDGGANMFTIRNNVGNLRLIADGGNKILCETNASQRLRADIYGFLPSTLQGDNSADFANYSWHQVAEVIITGNYQDRWITLLVTDTYNNIDYRGILCCCIRTDGNLALQSASLKWLIAGGSIVKENFVLVYHNNSNNVTGRIWVKIPNQYKHYKFTILDQGRRDNRDSSNVDTQDWQLKASSFGSAHGQANYTAGTGVVVSSYMGSQFEFLELYAATPYIDFHFNNSTANYTSRIIETAQSDLRVITNRFLVINYSTNSRGAMELSTTSDNPNDLWFSTNGGRRWSLTARHSAESYCIGMYANNSPGGWVQRWFQDKSSVFEGRVTIKNHLVLWTQTAGNSFNESGSAIQLREVNCCSTTQTAWTYAPKIGFHWGSKAAVQLGMNSSQELCLYNNSNTTGATMRAGPFISENANSYRAVGGTGTTKSVLLRNDGTNFWILCCNAAGNGNNWYTPTGGGHPFWINLADGYCHATRMYNGVWNDYAEHREADTIEPGYVVCEKGDGTMTLTKERLAPVAKIISDTYGYSMGESEKAKTPIAVSGRVLVYPYKDRSEYKIGDCVCSAPGGKVDIMTREEIINYPDRIIGIVSEIPAYSIWMVGGGPSPDNITGKGKPIKVNGRIWVYVR